MPAIFLSSSFNLEDPDTFYSVFSHVTANSISTSNSKVIQEKVSAGGREVIKCYKIKDFLQISYINPQISTIKNTHKILLYFALQLFQHLETVEVDMSRQIVRKSSAFFDTMTYLNAQMEQLKLNHAAVSNLRYSCGPFNTLLYTMFISFTLSTNPLFCKRDNYDLCVFFSLSVIVFHYSISLFSVSRAYYVLTGGEFQLCEKSRCWSLSRSWLYPDGETTSTQHAKR